MKPNLGLIYRSPSFLGAKITGMSHCKHFGKQCSFQEELIIIGSFIRIIDIM